MEEPSSSDFCVVFTGLGDRDLTGDGERVGGEVDLLLRREVTIRLGLGNLTGLRDLLPTPPNFT